MTAQSKPKFPIKDLVAAGPDAARVLVRHAVETAGADAARDAERARSSPDFEVEKHVDALIDSQLQLARAEGAGAGAAATLAEMSSFISGPGAVAVMGTTILADMAALATIQVRLSLMIAAAYGHSMDDTDMRVREILSLHGLEMTTTKVASPAAAAAGQRIGKRLLERYLRGSLLQALKSMFRLVGVKFSRAALVRGLPVINIPVGAAFSDITTRRTASKARKYYRTLPAGHEA